MFGSRAVKLTMVAAAAIAMALLVVVTGSSHEDDAEPAALSCQGPGPDPAQPVAMPRELIGLEIVMGLNGSDESRWEGDIQVSEGRVLELDVVRSGANPRIEGTHFSIGTPKAKAAAKKKKKQAVAKKKQGLAAMAILRVTLDAPADAKVTVKTGQGEFAFAPADLTRGRRADLPRRPGLRRAAGRGDPSDRPRAPRTTIPVARQGARRLGLARLRRLPARQPRPLGTVNAGDFDDARPEGQRRPDPPAAVRRQGLAAGPRRHRAGARTSGGRPWPSTARGSSGSPGRSRSTATGRSSAGRYTPPGKGGGEGTWSEIVRVTRAPGTDFHVVAATDASRGRLARLASLARRTTSTSCVAAQQDGPRLERAAGRSPRARPTTGARPSPPTAQGNVYVAWDTYDKGNYDVRLRASSARTRSTRAVADSARFEARPHLACDKDGRRLDRLRGGRRAVGQGLRPRGAGHATSASRRTPASRLTSTGRSR